MTTSLIPITCPECGGNIWRIDDGNLVQFRCRVGHLYSPKAAVSIHSEREENTLWSAAVVLEEGAELAEQVADIEGGEPAELLRAQAQQKRALADQVKKIAREFPKVSVMRLNGSDGTE